MSTRVAPDTMTTVGLLGCFEVWERSGGNSPFKQPRVEIKKKTVLDKHLNAPVVEAQSYQKDDPNQSKRNEQKKPQIAKNSQNEISSNCSES